jgi:4'-phosphopantetheinyl transferase EntD
MMPDTRCPELERQFIVAGCGQQVAVHVASNNEAIDGHDLGDIEFPVDANPTRRKEFIAGRTLAQRCLIDLGQPPTPIGFGVAREPLWPNGVVGSIAHTGTFAAAVVWLPSVEQQSAGIGIDAEHCGRLDSDIWPTVFTPKEIVRLEQAPLLSRDLMATCMFSAKEAVYKAQFPLTRRFIEFDELAIWMQPPGAEDCRKASLRLEHDIRELSPFHFSVFYYCFGSFVITGAVVLTEPVTLQSGT